MIIRGNFQVINGVPSVVGKPDSWRGGFDDWELKPGDRLTVERDEGTIYCEQVCKAHHNRDAVHP